MLEQESLFLVKLVSAGLRGRTVEGITIPFDAWNHIYDLARSQAVLPLAFAGIASIRTQIPADLFAKWRGAVLRSVVRNEKIMLAQDTVIRLLASYEIPCVVLKGCSLSVLYQSEDLRQLGDVDVLVRSSDFDRAVSCFRENGYHMPEKTHPFHVDTNVDGVVVELHHAVSLFPDTACGNTTERIMDGWLADIQWKCLREHKFPVLSDTRQAICLLLHKERHLLSDGIGLRQLCDWLAFVEHIPTTQFVNIILPATDSCGLSTFAKVLTKTCVRFLDLDAEHVSWCMDVEDSIADAMMEEILRAGNFGRAVGNDDASRLFVEGDSTKTPVRNLLKTLNASARRDFPITKKAPVLLPVFWIYLPIRYWIRSLMGLRPRKSIRKTVSTAQKRKQLYDDLHLFEIQ